VASSVSENRKVFFSPLSKMSCRIENASTILLAERRGLKLECDDFLIVINDLIKQYFRKGPFVTRLHDSDFALAEYTLSIRPSDTTTIGQLIGSPQVEEVFRYPKKGFLAERSVEADIVIFVSEIGIAVEDLWLEKPAESRKKYSSKPGGGAPPSHGGMMTSAAWSEKERIPTMSAAVKYIVWDYERDTALGYGQFVIEGGPYKLYSKNIGRTWTYFAASVLETISSETPFIKEFDPADCPSRPEVQDYMEEVHSRFYEHWNMTSGFQDTEVELRFKIDVAGLVLEVELADGDRVVGASAVAAMRAASPFSPLPDSIRCLTDFELTLIFSTSGF
jgi:hypothetical protein